MNFRVLYREANKPITTALNEIVCHEGCLEATIINILNNGGIVWELSEYKGEF